MKRRVSLWLVLILILGLSSCGVSPNKTQTEQQSPSQAVDENYIPMIALGYGHQFWQAVKSGAEGSAKKLGITMTFEGPEQETMVDKQVDMLKTALSKNPKAICMAAIDIEAVRPDLEEAKKNGVKVVGFDAGVGDLADVTVTTDSYRAGQLAAENAVRLLNGKGKVGIVGHSQTVVDAVARVKGFVDKINEASGIELVDTQYGEGDHLKSADIAKSMMQAHPDINLIYTSNEGACVGVYNGLKEIEQIGKVIIIGFDSSKAMKDAIRAGEISGAITQDPVSMGALSIESAYKLLRNESLEEFVDTGCYWYDKSNMDDAKIAPLLYD